VSTVNEREMLRRAMQLADGIEPRADGLQRIQARLRPPRPLAIAWAEAAWTFLRMRVPAALEALVELLRNMAGLAWERFGPTRGGSAGRARTLGWLRPAVALGVTVFIVAAGTYIAINTQQGISPSASNAARSSGGSGGARGGAGGSGRTSTQGHSSLGPRTSTGPTPKATCRPATSAKPAPSTSVGQIQSSSPSPTPTDTGGGSPSPTPTDSSTPTPGATSTGQASISTSGTDVPAVGSTAPIVAALLTSHSISESSSVTSSLPICGKKRPVKHNSPGPTPAVFSFSKLDDGR
jgi:hypothetical protein